MSSLVSRPLLRPVLTEQRATFNEGDHPRDPNGEFASGGGSTAHDGKKEAGGSKLPTAAKIDAVSKSRKLFAYNTGSFSAYKVQGKPGTVTVSKPYDGSAPVLLGSNREAGAKLISQVVGNVKDGFSTDYVPVHADDTHMAGLVHAALTERGPMRLDDAAPADLRGTVDLLEKRGLVERFQDPLGRTMLRAVERQKKEAPPPPADKTTLAHGAADKYPGSANVPGIASQPAGSMERKLREVEYHEMAGLPKERGVAYDKNGQVLVAKAGTSKKVTWTPDEVKLVKDGIMTHNHPGGAGALSPTDIVFAHSADLAEIRAVDRHSPDPSVTDEGKPVEKTFLYRAVRPPGGWPEPERVKALYKAIGKIEEAVSVRDVRATQARLREQIKAKPGDEPGIHLVVIKDEMKKALDSANLELQHNIGHRIWTEIAPRLGIHYERVQLD